MCVSRCCAAAVEMKQLVGLKAFFLVENTFRIPQDRHRHIGHRLPRIELCPQFGSPTGHRLRQIVLLTGIVLEIVETDCVIFMELNHFPVASAETGRGKTTPRVGLASGHVDRQASSLQIKRVMPENAPLADFLAHKQRRNVRSVNGLRRGKLAAGELRKGG